MPMVHHGHQLRGENENCRRSHQSNLADLLDLERGLGLPLPLPPSTSSTCSTSTPPPSSDCADAHLLHLHPTAPLLHSRASPLPMPPQYVLGLGNEGEIVSGSPDTTVKVKVIKMIEAGPGVGGGIRKGLVGHSGRDRSHSSGRSHGSGRSHSSGRSRSRSRTARSARSARTARE